MEKWVMKRITKMGDITDDEGMSLSYSEINQKFNLEQLSRSFTDRSRELIYDVTKCLIDTIVIYCNNGKIQLYLKQNVRMFTGIL